MRKFLRKLLGIEDTLERLSKVEDVLHHNAILTLYLNGEATKISAIERVNENLIIRVSDLEKKTGVERTVQ